MRVRKLIRVFLPLATVASLPLHAQCSYQLAYSFSPQSLYAGEPITVTLTAVSPSLEASGTLLLRVTPVAGGAGFFATAPFTNNTAHFTVASLPAGKDLLTATMQPGSQCIPSPATTQIVVGPAGGPNASLLQGTYAFSFQGSTVSSPGLSNQAVALGSFIADGQGTISSGVEDINSAVGTMQTLPLTGTYSIDSVGNGRLALASSQGTTHFSFFVTADQLKTRLQQGAFIATDQNGVFGNGALSKQTAANESALPGSYGLTLHGEDPEGAKLSAASGMLALGSDHTAAGEIIASIPPAVSIPATVNGTFGALDPTTDRFTLSLPASSEDATQPTHYVGYAVDATHFYLMSLEPHSTFRLFSGSAAK